MLYLPHLFKLLEHDHKSRKAILAQAALSESKLRAEYMFKPADEQYIRRQFDIVRQRVSSIYDLDREFVNSVFDIEKEIAVLIH